MEIISWETGINRIITNESVPSLGEGALHSNKSENGTEMTSLKNSDTPDVWSVVMYFSNSTEDSFYINHTLNGVHVTEWEAFVNWFKYKLNFGTKAFYFNKIGTENETAVYKIRSDGLPKPTVLGTWMKVTMSWSEYKTSAISVTTPVVSGDFIDVSNGIIDFYFNEKPETFPQKSEFNLYYQNYDEHGDLLPQTYPIVLERIIYDGSKIVQMYFQEIEEQGVIYISAEYMPEQGETSVVHADLEIKVENSGS